LKTGLFFGSFNPIHIGHMILAGYMAEFTDLEQVWFVVSPHNPLKIKSTLLDDYHRLELVRLAIGEDKKLAVSDIEFRLPKPSYTIDSLAYMKEKYPSRDFVLIMGEDNLASINKWKNYEKLLENYLIYVYPRAGYDGDSYKNHPSVKFVDAPIVEISSTFIRNAIKSGKNIQYMLPEKVYNYILEMNFYKK
jgi:nicotinate-nucleotide adenylyltransferase